MVGIEMDRHIQGNRIIPNRLTRSGRRGQRISSLEVRSLTLAHESREDLRQTYNFLDEPIAPLHRSSEYTIINSYIRISRFLARRRFFSYVIDRCEFLRKRCVASVGFTLDWKEFARSVLRFRDVGGHRQTKTSCRRKQRQQRGRKYQQQHSRQCEQQQRIDKRCKALGQHPSSNLLYKLTFLIHLSSLMRCRRNRGF